MAEFQHVALGRYQVLHVGSGNRLWASRGYRVLFSDDLGATFQIRASYAAPVVRRVSAGLRPLARLLRTGILGLLPLPEGALLAAVRGHILRCDAGDDRFVSVLARPGRNMKLALMPDGRVYSGEYFANRDRGPVSVYSSMNEGRSWEVAHTFPAGSVCHVHSLTYDPFRRGLLVLTGDLAQEPKVLFTPDGFRTMKILLEGGQSSRAYSAIPCPDGIYLPTDSQYEQNYVQFLRADGALQRLHPIAGSCLAACRVGEWVFFGTAKEPSRVNRDRTIALYGTRDRQEWHELARWATDCWSGPTDIQATLFQFPRLVMPGGENATGCLFATTVATRGTDGVLHRWKVT